MAERLVVIDMQTVFTDAGSEWYAPGAAELSGPIGRLAERFPNVVRTRFVAPAEPTGAWVDYYAAWPFALAPPDAALWNLVEGLPDGADLTATTFSKWGPELAALVGDGPMVLCGVATDCCVLSTAVAALDEGVSVRVVGDACAGSSAEAHEQTLSVLAGYAPLLRVTSVAEELTPRRY